MKHTIEMFKEKLESEIKETAHASLNSSTLKVAESLGRAWLLYDDIWCRLNSYAKPHVNTPAPLTVDEAKSWANHMENADDTSGPHWTMEQTTAVANSNGVEFTHISEWCWWVTLNMMYSDYYSAAVKYGVNTPGFYADMAKAFLFDKDGPGPKEKLAAYYNYIVKKH